MSNASNDTIDKNCPICDNQAKLYPKIGDNERYSCLRCGEYKISGTDLEILKIRPLNDCEREKVSQAIKNLPRLDGQLLILADVIDNARKGC